jgi:hypothetical protein
VSFFVNDVIVAPLVSRFVVGGGSVIRVETRCHMGAGREDRASLGYTVFCIER